MHLELEFVQALTTTCYGVILLLFLCVNNCTS